MTPEQRAAYIIAQTGCALIEALGMLSENMLIGMMPKEAASAYVTAHRASEFIALIEKYSIHHNAVIKLFHE